MLQMLRIQKWPATPAVLYLYCCGLLSWCLLRVESGLTQLSTLARDAKRSSLYLYAGKGCVTYPTTYSPHGIPGQTGNHKTKVDRIGRQTSSVEKPLPGAKWKGELVLHALVDLLCMSLHCAPLWQIISRSVNPVTCSFIGE